MGRKRGNGILVLKGLEWLTTRDGGGGGGVVRRREIWVGLHGFETTY